jgi:hypothetical protein
MDGCLFPAGDGSLIREEIRILFVEDGLQPVLI